MNTKAFFPCWEVPNLVLGIGMENQTFFVRTPAAQIMTLWREKKILLTQMDLYYPYMVPYTIL